MGALPASEMPPRRRYIVQDPLTDGTRGEVGRYDHARPALQHAQEIAARLDCRVELWDSQDSRRWWIDARGVHHLTREDAA